MSLIKLISVFLITASLLEISSIRAQGVDITNTTPFPSKSTGTIKRSTGHSTPIELNLPVDKTVPTMNDLITQTRPSFAANFKIQLRVQDCEERTQVAWFVFQLRDQKASLAEIHKIIDDSIQEAEPTFLKTAGVPIPEWYKIEFHRIVNDMERMKPTDLKQFAVWVGKQCVKFGPWLNPIAK